eukprot:TRINITY_DN59552_c0_g2_i1.p1 TRINITY_DN59552_c0_g2~~TRINITY_DN59552_c0_g2_i1.p1  ORF type:complete len:238 (-),score=20.98 TRINITY_DN59552_c0_g2_i1:217-897(-)
MPDGITIYGAPISQPCRAIMWALTAKGISYDFKMVMPGGRGAKLEVDYKTLNPTGQIPTITDGDFVLRESNAILTYLADKYGWEDWYPKDLKTRAKIDEYLHWHHNTPRGLSLAAARPLLVPGGTSDPKRDAKMVKKALTQLEGMLSKGKYLIGNSVTLADIACYCEVDQLLPEYFDLVDMSPYPNVLRWARDMRNVPGHDQVRAPMLKFKPNLERMKASSGRPKL